MARKVLLSFTTLDNYHRASHTWICKMMGIVQPESEAMTAGKEAHKKLQEHLLGKVQLPIDLPWQISKAEVHAQKEADDLYSFHGFLDGVDYKTKTLFEIKTGGTPWSQKKFYDSIQPRYYSWVTGLRSFVFITCHFDLSGLKVYSNVMTDDDWKLAEDWANGALRGIKAGEFKGGLDESGHCLGCNYGQNCHFL